MDWLSKIDLGSFLGRLVGFGNFVSWSLGPPFQRGARLGITRGLDTRNGNPFS